MTQAGSAALIAGASNPLTRQIAVSLAEHGMDVALSTTAGGDAATFSMNSIANELWALDRRHLAIPAGDDPADPVRQTLNELGRLDLLVTLPEREATEIAGGAAVLDYLRGRLGGVLLLCEAAAAVMTEGAAAILNCVVRGDTSSLPVFAASEAGIEAATCALARELQPRIAVNAAVVGENTDPRRIATLALELLGTQVSGQAFELWR